MACSSRCSARTPRSNEVIVVDNGSTDGSRDIVAHLGLFSRVAWLALGGVVLLYLTVLAIAAAQLAWSRRTWRAMPAYIAAFCTVELCNSREDESQPILVPREDWTKR